MQKPQTIRIGTRGSQLALVQANMVKRLILEHHPNDMDVNIVTIRTTGDRILDQPLTEIGGKGLFIKEIEEQLLDNNINMAVHSMKDLPAFLPDALKIVSILEREDPRDVLVCHDHQNISDLPKDAVIGTSSPRRIAQARHILPHANIIPFRGNVSTRLQKLENKEVDATFLAYAGLKRLDITKNYIHPLTTKQFLPAVAQGAIGIEIHRDAHWLEDILAPINHRPTQICVSAERAFLAEFEGSCHTPVAALATLSADSILLDCLIAKPDGTTVIRTSREGSTTQGTELAIDAAHELKSKGGDGFFD